MIRIVIGRNNGDGIRLVSRGMFCQLNRTVARWGADMDDDWNPRARLIKRDGSGLFAFFGGHGRPLPGGTEYKQALDSGANMKVHQLPHDRLIDPALVVEGSNYW